MPRPMESICDPMRALGDWRRMLNMGINFPRRRQRVGAGGCLHEPPGAYTELLEQGWGKGDYDPLVHSVGLGQAHPCRLSPVPLGRLTPADCPLSPWAGSSLQAAPHHLGQAHPCRLFLVPLSSLTPATATYSTSPWHGGGL